jgi:hypothetical protein
MTVDLKAKTIDKDRAAGRIRQNIYLYEAQWDFLRHYAHLHYASMSEVLRALIDGLAREDFDVELDKKLRRMNRHPQEEKQILPTNSILMR